MDAVKDRLLQFIEHKNISVAEFEQSASLGNGIISKPSKLSKKTIDKICAAYTEINREWLNTGEGEMTNPDPKPMPEAISITESTDVTVIINSNSITIYPHGQDATIRILQEENKKLRDAVNEMQKRIDSLAEKDGNNG